MAGFRFRCRRYWLKGDRNGTLDTFAENLPGGPDNINLAPDGSFWIALIKVYMLHIFSKGLIEHMSLSGFQATLLFGNGHSSSEELVGQKK